MADAIIKLHGPNAVRIHATDDVRTRSAFRKAVEGARWEKNFGCYIARLDLAIAISMRLNEAKFLVEFGEEALKMLRRKMGELKEDSSIADRHIEEAEARLRKNGHSLRPYQKEGIRRLAASDRVLLSFGMRLGKTATLLASLPDRPRLIVVAPATVKRVWEKEALLWRSDIFPTVHEGPAAGKLRWPNEGEMIVISYEKMEELPPAPPFVTVVADEAHMLKVKSSKRSQLFRRMARQALDNRGRVALLTATPLLDRAADLYSILEAGEMAEEVFGDFKRFYKLFNARKGLWKTVDGVEKCVFPRGTTWGEPEPEVHERLQRVMLRKTREEVFPDLPPRQYMKIPVPLPEALKKAQTKTVALMGGLEWLSKADLEEIGIAAPPNFPSVRREVAEAKIPALDEIVEQYREAREPLVIFSAHKAPIEHLKAMPDYGVVFGEESGPARQAAIDAFQAGKLAGIGLSIKAGGVGIRLTRASSVLFVDREVTPALNAQAEDRVLDVDDKEKRITVMSLVGDHPLEERIEELIRIKDATFDAAIDGRTE